MSSALFGSAARAANKNMVEFRAGKMHLKGKIVHPDKRKGLVYLYQADDSLMHFCWKDRTSGTVEEDLIIFPDDCEYRRVSACTSGRVYVLKFRSTTRRLFFWMQEPKTEKDDEHCRKINELLNNPPAPGSQSAQSRSGGTGGGSSSAAASSMLGGDLSNLRDSDLHNIIGNISQQQLLQILGSGVPNLSSLLVPSSGGSGGRASTTVTPTTASTPTTATTPPPPSTTTSATTTPATTTAMETSSSTAASASSGGGSAAGKAAGPIQLADLQNILSGMMTQGDAAAGGGGVDLSPALTAEALQPILSNPEFVEQLRPLLPATADTLPPADQLRGTVTSPQFKQAVSVFSHALQSGQLGPLVKQFGLGDDAVLAAAAADMEAFIKALGKNKSASSGSEAKKETKEEKKKKKEDDDDDENMAVD